MKCPSCEAELSTAMVAKMADESRLVWTVAPKPGEKLSAHTVGGTLVALDKMINSFAKDLGLKERLYVERIETSDEGEIAFHLVVVRFKSRASVEKAA